MCADRVRCQPVVSMAVVLNQGEFPTKGEFENFKGGIFILHSENPKNCV